MTDAGQTSPEREQHDTRSLQKTLDESLAFQRRWQRLSLAAYVFTTAGTLIASTAATYFAADKQGDLAAVLSAFTAVCIGLERSFLFREKWKFHLGIATRLYVLRSELTAGAADRKLGAVRLAEILGAYAESLPVAPRDAT